MEEIISKEIEFLEKKFINLNNLEVGDKLYYNNEIIEVSKKGIFQSVTRFYNLTDRHIFLQKFKEDINRINKLYDCMILNMSVLMFVFVKNYFENIKSIQTLYKLLLKSLSTLVVTYKDDEKYVLELTNLLIELQGYYKDNF